MKKDNQKDQGENANFDETINFDTELSVENGKHAHRREYHCYTPIPWKVIHGNVQHFCKNWGGPMLRNCDDHDQRNTVEFEIHAPFFGVYSLFGVHASNENRPMQLFIGDFFILDHAYHQITGGWHVDNRKTFQIDRNIYLPRGTWTVRLDRYHVMPHIWSFGIQFEHNKDKIMDPEPYNLPS